MNIRLMSCSNEAEEPNIAVRAKLMTFFSLYSDKCCTVKKYDSFAQLLPALADSLKSNQLSVIFTGVSDYAEIKNNLIKALHLKSEISVDILEKLPPDMSAVDKELHSTFPLNSVFFPTDNGTYCPFCCRSGKQYILFCPMVGNYIENIENNVAPFLSKIAISPTSEYEPYVKMFKDSAELLSKRSITAAVAKTNTAELIRFPAAIAGKAANSFKFSDIDIPSCDGDPQKYIADVAVRAAQSCNTLIGLAVSNIFSAKKHGAIRRVVYIAVSYENKVNISRVYSDSEDVTHFLKKAVCELFALLSCTVEKLASASGSDEFELF